MHTWQREFEHVQVKRPTRLGFTARRQLRSMPARYGRTCGGACYAFGHIWICVTLIDAPDFVRRYLVAHEWGHVVCGHGAARYAFLALAMSVWPLAIVKPGSIVLGIFALTSLALLLGLFVWMNNIKREYEADDVAVSINGREETFAARSWMNEWKGGADTAVRRQRLQRLK